ncbi:MAG TPA: Ppx/GppA phosphatase family protein [Peptococcaceae bacterium]|jgi:exopolyphosphatase/guanosine-5'-triphosphate,3'-diphosphate pyrophosphatase|nr:Ppx/GppA family phosphatase [Clostridia bacterium]HOB81637.1 Ppx/GppA phosphatase family protein [Peptococcaceae bacterium]HPZ71466.1 Ppx/GppA phosphatase family protein [Peptococcaceae bacterium]HQD53949.1 Ppx/GppA phosphatase family protein [Peptococcaceae bacterium]
MWAIMDLGTNSTRLLIASYNPHAARCQTVQRALRITRLGEGMNEQHKVLSAAAMERTVAALEEFAAIISVFPVQGVRLVATQAVREAANREELVEKIKRRLNWDLEVISGVQEAAWSYSGAVQGLKTPGIPLVVDIGGASTEFSVRTEPQKLQLTSLPLGALRLYEHPRTDAELQRILQEGLAGFAYPRALSLVAVGGTATTLAAVQLEMVDYDADRVQGLMLPLEEIEAIYRRLQVLEPAQRLKVAGITPGREDIIVAGLQILLAIMTFFRQKELTVSDQDLLHGIFWQELLKGNEAVP